MLGTLTLQGVQIKNLFVDEHGREFPLVNVWEAPNTEVRKFIQIRKFNEESWYMMRELRIECRKLK